jgi:inner membrane protein YidH
MSETRPAPEVSYSQQEELAQDRTALASERTYASWVRTGLASLAAGLGIAKFINDLAPVWTVRAIAFLLIALATLSFILAAWRYTGLCKKLKHLDISLIPHQIVLLISGFLIVCAGLSLVAIWMMTATA